VVKLFPLHAAYFYKAIDSQYPSGYMDSEALQKKTNQQKIKRTFVIQKKDQSVLQVKEEDIYFKSHFFTHAKSLDFTFTHEQPNFTASRSPLEVGDYKICEQNGAWLRLCGKGWLHRSVRIEFHNPNSLGYAFCKKECRIYLEPNIMRPVSSLAARTRFIINKANKNFYQVQWKGKKHFVYAGDVLVSKDLKQEQALYFYKNNKLEEKQAIAVEKVAILEQKEQHWLRSYIRGHGNVWWKASKQTPKSQTIITTAELLKNKIFDIAKSKSSKLQIASAGGIYRSFDGENWQKIDLFGQQDYPVDIDQNGDIYIGEYRSQDNGNHFHKFVRWPDIIHAVPDLKNKKLVIQDIFLAPQKVHFQVLANQQVYGLAKDKKTYRWQAMHFPDKIDLVRYGL
tara:strand:+ start:2648 stop:3835 length:1188 start_codon:yes stop_codon:yes gene_type:complete